ncbi:MAG TPA: class I SAM-dependent methyltransferase [Bacillaceae bacterium]
MLNRQGFDLWADGYDKTVQLSEENNEYPFAGYKSILGTIFNEVMQKEHSSVLDIGFGTGVLTSKLYEKGHRIYGIDFSPKMIAIAQAKMPEAHLIEWDISNGLPSFPEGIKFDSIISTYALHHLTDEAKMSFIKQLMPLLAEDGNIFIGDVAFRTRKELEDCRANSLGYWDENEFYFVFDEIKKPLENHGRCEFQPISHCGGILVISQ